MASKLLGRKTRRQATSQTRHRSYVYVYVYVYGHSK